MKQQLLRFAPWVALMVLGMFGTSTPANTEPQQRHARIRAAIEALRDANQYMREAGHDFCGHRGPAMRDTEAAIRQLEMARDCDRR